MKPVVDKNTNSVLKAPQDSPEVMDLPITTLQNINGVPFVESCWELSEEELKEVNKTKKIYFVCMGRTHPPMKLQVVSELD